MSWLEPNNEQPFPLSTDLARLLKDVQVTAVEFNHPAVDDILVALRESNVNGGAFFGSFSVAANPTLEWLFSRNQVEKAIDRAPLLQADAIFNTFSELVREPRIIQEPKWEGVSDLTFSGELAHTLRCGGAYKSVPTLRAIELADNFRKCLFQDRYDDMCIFRSFTAWNSWFWEVAWDQTWFIVDKRMQRFSMLIATDTD